MHIPPAEKTDLEKGHQICRLVVEKEMPWCFVQQPEITIRLPEPIVEVKILATWPHAPRSYPQQARLARLECPFQLTTESDLCGDRATCVFSLVARKQRVSVARQADAVRAPFSRFRLSQKPIEPRVRPNAELTGERLPRQAEGCRSLLALASHSTLMTTTSVALAQFSVSLGSTTHGPAVSRPGALTGE